MRNSTLFVLLFFIGACNTTEPEPPSILPPKVNVCFTVEPKDALVIVQGAKLKPGGCVETFPGQVSVDASAPGYKRYKSLVSVEGHASIQRIVLLKDDTPTSAPASSPTTQTKPAGN
jgi:hypothetical protein